MKRQRARELRAAVDRLPLSTRKAMLDGIQTKSIIAGADGNLSGGVCPMYAASSGASKRAGRPFARAWDGYTRTRFSRPATQRELLTLRSMLQASIEVEVEPPVVSLEGAIVAHTITKERNKAALRGDEERPPQSRRELQDTGERDRTSELRTRHGWAWLRPFRRYDEYERAVVELSEAVLEHAESEGRELEAAERELVSSHSGR
jgi:hypothetical protein